MEIKEAFKFCPRCGNKFSKRTEFLKCPNCGLSLYNNPKSASSVILQGEDGKYLFGVRKTEPRIGYLDEIGGFVNENENAEEAAIRETWEEIGVKIDPNNLVYVGTFLGHYDFQNITYPVLNIVYKAALPKNAKITPKDDVAGYKFYMLNEVPTDRLAFDWLRDLLIELAK